MTSKPLQELDTAALYRQRSRVKGLIIAIVILWFLLLAITIYLIFFKKAGLGHIGISVPLTYMLIPLSSSLSKINAEIKLRNANI